MIYLVGSVLNVFKQPEYKDKKTGEVSPEHHKVQLAVKNELKNGEIKMDIHTLKVEKPDFFNDNIGKDIFIKVGALASGRVVTFFTTNGGKDAGLFDGFAFD